MKTIVHKYVTQDLYSNNIFDTFFLSTSNTKKIYFMITNYNTTVNKTVVLFIVSKILLGNIKICLNIS